MPSSGILTTKLAPPRPVGGTVRRGRLHERLDGVPDGGLAVVTGAPGAGKTSLLADWAHGCPDPVAWVSLDDDDNDAAAFWQAVATAVTAALTGPDGPPPAPVGLSAPADAVLRVVDDRLGDGRLWLVLDDLHHVHDPAVVHQLDRLVRRQPAGMRTVVASRVDPTIGVAALRVRGLVVDVTDDDLHFTEAETQSALAANGVALDPAALTTLVHRTDGWAAGIGLALQAMQGLDRPGEFVARFDGSQRVVAEFLLEEGLERQTDEIRAFLLQTSVLDELTAPLCDHVRERTDSASLLREIERRHLFVQRLDTDDGSAWYRLHDLFRDALERELTADDPTAVARLRRRAADWLDDHGRAADAIRQYLAAGETDAAAATIARVETELLQRGWADTLSGWYEQLPPAVQPDEIRMLRLFWAAAFVDNIPRAELILARLGTTPAAADEVDLPTETTLASAFLAFRRGDMTATLDLADAAVAGFDARAQHGSGGFALAVVLGADARMYHGQSAEAERRLRALLADPATRGDITAIEAQAALAAAVGKQGRYTESLALAADVLGTLDPSDAGPRTLPEAWLAVAGAHLSRGRFDLATADVERARLDAAGFRGGPVFAVIADEVAAHIRWQRGDVDGALDEIDRLLRRAEERGVGHDVARRARDRHEQWQAIVRQRSGVPPLTTREQEVLVALASYRSLQEIADGLYVSLNTLKSHLKGIYAKLGVSSRNDAVRRAIELGFIPSMA